MRGVLSTRPHHLACKYDAGQRRKRDEVRSRIRAAFDIKRANLSEIPWSGRCPGWLRLDKDTGQFIVVEERANVVRRIYRETLAGTSHESMARRMNEEQVPLFGHGNQRGKMWQKSLVRHLLYSPTVVGTFAPFSTEWVDGVRRMRPLTPVENYYPAVIEKSDWDRVQTKRAAWLAHHNYNPARSGRANLLAGLTRCPYCDHPMTMLRCVSASKFDPAHIPSITLILLMVCAFVPIGDRLLILTPSHAFIILISLEILAFHRGHNWTPYGGQTRRRNTPGCADRSGSTASVLPGLGRRIEHAAPARMGAQPPFEHALAMEHRGGGPA
jgi:hypothetical protein